MKPTKVIVMAWYRETDYERILALMEDRHLLPATFEDWEKKAQLGHKQSARNGQTVMKIYIDPEQFGTWCKLHKRNIDAQARIAFAVQEANRILKDAQKR